VTGRRRPNRPGEWWTTYFDLQYLREYEPLLSPGRDRRETARLIDVLELPVGARILDVPCGHGRHARLLAEAGYEVHGVDYSAHMLAAARAKPVPRRVTFHRGDMRRLPRSWAASFDAVVNLFTSFGFFLDPADDARVIGEFSRVLKPGGVLVWHGGSRDGVMARFLSRDWWMLSDETLVGHERTFDPLAGVLHVRARWRGARTGGEREQRIRLYTATRIAELCADAGLVVERAYDDFTARPLRRRTTEMLLVARKEVRR
jgi:ubiquinone/menaquinone biosynthesis C-methylase UbiE